MKTDVTRQRNQYSWLESLYVLVLGMYPLRHIYMGLDLWDTGYNYANFQYMGTEHMDSMWLFATYLSNVVGNFIMKLPAAGSLAGMNFYTALFVSVMALAGYFFCTKKLNISPLVAFVGEFLAISLCWCPTAKLYDYLTFLLFLACVILLYYGLTQEREKCLFVAGICLGANVLVRFSNLPEAAMIVAVWAYGVIEAAGWRKTVKRTLVCLGGYVSALVVLLGYISIVYGLDEYVAGISRLFAMTDNATDYKAASMLTGLVKTYTRELYWVVRISLIALAGVLVCGAERAIFRYIKPLARAKVLRKAADICCHVFCVLLGGVVLVWLYRNEFCSFAFRSYDSMLRPGILFLVLTMFLAVIRIFCRNCPKEEKLISGIVLLVVLLTSVGSNTGVYPSLNNLFIAAPYTMWQCARFVGGAGERVVCIGKRIEVVLHPLALKCVLVAFLAMVLFQSTMFGAEFVFVESTGAQEDMSATVENNEVLKGIQMSPERAEWLSSISAYVEEHDLKGKEIILYGEIPSMSYYLQMPSAFNPWCDLRSYSVKQMEADMKEVEAEMEEKETYRPVVLVDKVRLEYLDQTEKWQMIVEFMERYEYEQTFENDRFILWE